MVSNTRALNVIQSIPYLQKSGTITDITTVIYTVPAGKKALVITANVSLVAYGAGTQAGLKISGTRVLNFISGTDPLGALKAVNNCVMVAGDTIIGDSNGANPTENFFITIQETPV